MKYLSAFTLLFVSAPLLCITMTEHLREQKSSACRVMTFNIEQSNKFNQDEAHSWPKRLPRITEILSATQPDIIGMQEPLKNQLEDLSAELPGYSRIGNSRGSLERIWDTNEFNPIWYKTDRFSVHDSGTFPIDGEPWIIIRVANYQEYGWLPRICTWALLEDKESNTKFYVYNTHLDHMYDQVRESGLEKILKYIQEHHTDYPIILMGDFNTPLEGTIQEHLTTASFQNSKEHAQTVHGPETTYTGYGKEKEKTIDHILVKADSIIHQHCTIPENEDGYPSDHRPVFVDITLPAIYF